MVDNTVEYVELFKNLSKCFLESQYHFTFLPAKYEFVSHCDQHLIWLKFLILVILQVVVIAYCGLYFRFHNDF